MQDRGGDLTCCARCGGPGTAARIADRRRYKAAVFSSPYPGLTLWPGAADPAARTEGLGTSAPFPAVVTGTATDVSPHVLVVANAGGEQRFSLPTGAVAWRGKLVPPTIIRAGDQLTVRIPAGRRDVADKIWVGIGRVTGTIVERHGDSLLVDEGATKPPQAVVISPGASSRIQVRFPRLEPGHLVDVIGLRQGATLEALLPATSQPTYRADRMPRLSPVTGLTYGSISGSATWHEPTGLAPAEGVAYPAIDPASGCAEAAASSGPGCASLPYLAVGSMLLVRNECTGRSRLLPVTGCGAVARLFSDRCLTCGTSPRGRVADLTLASFVGLGGDLERGCFNAAIAIGA
ncbi:MAG TPA: hypothetical protein VMV17_19420 [Streptosporangiaceae bacterium]|nr:hypothetical protein [Streptosporangiaceae bacterium]